MTQTQLIALAKTGERVATLHSFHTKEDTQKSQTCWHAWRTIVCDGDEDVKECRHCGQQKLTRCTFDDEGYA